MKTLLQIYSGWGGYQTSLVNAISPLTPAQLAYRPMPDRRSVGEIAAHIAFGRIDWFSRMGAPGSTELADQVRAYYESDGRISKAVTEDSTVIVRWLNASWKMIEANLTNWTVADLEWTYLQSYVGNTYSVSRQWVVWRIMAHDIHHGGQLTILLAEQGIDPPDLSGQGGHIIEPPVVETPIH